MSVLRFLVAAVAGVACFASATAKDLVVGFVAPMSGPASIYGQQARAGAQAYFDEVNKSGGLAGRRLRLTVADDEFKAASTVAHVRRMIHEEGVVAFISGAGAANWDAVVKEGALQDGGVPVVGVITAATVVRQPSHHNLFFLRPAIRDEVVRIFKQGQGMGFTRIAVLYQDDAFGKDALEGVKIASGSLKVEPVANVGHLRDGSDIPAAMDKILAATPSLIAILSTSNAAAAAVKIARERRFAGQPSGSPSSSRRA